MPEPHGSYAKKNGGGTGRRVTLWKKESARLGLGIAATAYEEYCLR